MDSRDAIMNGHGGLVFKRTRQRNLRTVPTTATVHAWGGGGGGSSDAGGGGAAIPVDLSNSDRWHVTKGRLG